MCRSNGAGGVATQPAVRSRSWSDIEAAFPMTPGAVHIEDIEVRQIGVVWFTMNPCSMVHVLISILVLLSAKLRGGDVVDSTLCYAWQSSSLIPIATAKSDVSSHDLLLRQVCQREDGSLWQLGAGSFGAVRPVQTCFTDQRDLY